MKNPNYKIMVGDNRKSLRTLEPNSIDAIVTDPPYELGFMGKGWDNTGIANDVMFWDDCLRVLKPGGHLVAFSGSRTYHRMTCAIEDAGFEIRDQIMWVYGSGFPKSLDVGKKIEGWDGWGTALKPAHEPICVARKPLEGTVADNVMKWGTGALNINGCRVGTEVRINQPMGAPQNSFGGYGATATATANKVQGRWPANLIHDGSQEVLELFPETGPSKASKRGLQHSGRHGGLADLSGKIKEGTDYIRGHEDLGGSAARFFYCPKASKKDRDEGCEEMEERRGGSETFDPNNRDGVGEERQPMRRNFHPTVKPTELMAYLCRLVTPPGGLILDPFMGSGSTGKAAIREGFRFVGMELSQEYADIAAARIAHEEGKAK